MRPIKETKYIQVETSYDPRTQRYTIVALLNGGTMSRRRHYDSHGEALEAVERANPGYEARVA